MQFPWREYIWLVILLGLAIGLAVERTRVTKLTVLHDQAAEAEVVARNLAAEIAARNLAAEIAAKNNTDPQFTEFQPIRFTARDQTARTKQTVFVAHVRETSSHEESYLTGMADLDWLLLYAFVLFPAIFGVIYFINAQHQTRGQKVKQSLTTFRAFGCFNILFMLGWSINHYAAAEFYSSIFSTKPFSGAIFLSFGAVFVVRYFQMSRLSQAEFDQLIEQNGGALWKALGTREWLRFKLSDIFWLTLAVGLGCAIYTEHRHAESLSAERGRAQWWHNAAEALREELNLQQMQ